MVVQELFLFFVYLYGAVGEPAFNFDLWLPQSRSRARYVPSQGRSSATLQPYLQAFLSNEFELPISLPVQLNNRSDASKRDLLIYVHMPKTAGQTFHRVVVNSFKGCKLDDMDCHPNYEKFENESEANNSPVANRFDLTFAAPLKIQERLINFSGVSDFFAPYTAGCGHVDVSVTTRLPDRKVLFMTVLREPISRVASLYDYMSAASKHVVECIDAVNKGEIAYATKTSPATSSDPYLKQVCSEPIVARMAAENISLAKHMRLIKDEYAYHLRYHSKSRPFLLSPTTLPPNVTISKFLDMLKAVEYDNFMTRSLTGSTTRSLLQNSSLPRLSQAQSLALAKQMLLAFPFVGLQERFADSVELFLWTFGFPPASLNDKFMFNKSEKNPILTPEVEHRIREMDFLDTQLYAFGAALFERRFQLMKMSKLANTKL